MSAICVIGHQIDSDKGKVIGALIGAAAGTAAAKKTGNITSDAYRAEVGQALAAELKAFPYPVVENNIKVE